MKKFFKKWLAPTKFKRLFDIFFSLLALIILSPVFLVIMAIIYFTPDCKIFFS
ncbi:MAG: sugar transferase, partial [Eubacterium sp.]|nr:sugar transferase [Eubacterium sp.]